MGVLDEAVAELASEEDAEPRSTLSVLDEAAVAVATESPPSMPRRAMGAFETAAREATAPPRTVYGGPSAAGGIPGPMPPLVPRIATQAEVQRTPPGRPGPGLFPQSAAPPPIALGRLQEVPEPVLPGTSTPEASDLLRAAVTQAVGAPMLAEAEEAARVPTRQAAGLPPAYPGEREGLKPEAISAAPPPRIGLVQQIGRFPMRSLARMGEQVGTALQYGAELVPRSVARDPQTVAAEAAMAAKSKEAGKIVERHWQETAKAWRSGYEGRHVWDDPGLLLDPGYLTATVGEISLSLLPSVVGFGAGQALTFSLLGRSMALTPQTVARLARLGGAVVGGEVVGLQEGMGTFQEAKARGMTDAKAARVATVASLAVAGLSVAGVPCEPYRFAPDPSAIERTVRRALADAQVSPEEVDLWFASRNGVLEMDHAEEQVIHAIFGDAPPRPVFVKDAIGEMAASGGGQIVAASRALADPDGPFPPAVRPRRALINSFGAGGNFFAGVLESVP